LQQAYVPQQLFPAVCGRLMFFNNCLLQLAARFPTVLKVSCNLRQGFQPFGKSPAICSKVSNHFESLLQSAARYQTILKVSCNIAAENSGLKTPVHIHF
jgi:hypothetical protein